MIADNRDKLTKKMSNREYDTPLPFVKSFLPLNLLLLDCTIDHKENLMNSTGGRDNNESCGVIQFIGTPSSILIDVPRKSFANDNLHKSDRQAYDEKWVINSTLSTSLHILTDKGICHVDKTLSSNLVESTTSVEFSGIAIRAGTLVTSSSSSKKCSFYNLKISSENNSVQENILPIFYESTIKSENTVTSFSVSDVAIKFFSSKKNEIKKGKEKEISATKSATSNTNDTAIDFMITNKISSTATLHPDSKISQGKSRNGDRSKECTDKNRIVVGQNAILFLGDSSGFIHFCIASNSMLLDTGSFRAHTSPVVSVLTTGELDVVMFEEILNNLSVVLSKLINCGLYFTEITLFLLLSIF